MAPAERPLAFRWLDRVLSPEGPPSRNTKLVLAAVFQRIDWKTGDGYFEAARTLSARLGIGKSMAAQQLCEAVRLGWLTREPRAVTGKPERRGYVYALKLPESVSGLHGQRHEAVSGPAGQRHEAVSGETGQKKELCPVSQAPVSGFTATCVRPDRTDSPLTLHRNSQSADARTHEARAPRTEPGPQPNMPRSLALRVQRITDRLTTRRIAERDP